MTLLDILPSATGAFLVGLGAGLAGLPEKYEEGLELLELIPEKDRLATNKNSTDAELAYLKSRVSFMKHYLPFAVGFAGPAIQCLTSQNPEILKNAFISVPCAYIGNFIGARIRRARTKKSLDLQKNLIRASQDFENADKYLLPDNKRVIVEQAFSEIETKLLGEDIEDSLQELTTGPDELLYDTLKNEPSPCNSMLVNWCLNRHAKLVYRIAMQRQVREFYELPYQEKVGLAEVVDLTALGEVKMPKAKVFTRERDDFYVQTFDWPNLKMMSDDKTGAVSIEGKRPQIEVSEREAWTGDYKALAEFIAREREDYSVFLMKAPLEINENLREQTVTSIFLEYFAKENLKKS